MAPTFIRKDRSLFRRLSVEDEPVQVVARSVAAQVRTCRAADGFEVLIPLELIDRLVHFGQGAAPNEWYGLLVGRLCEDDQGSYARIMGAVPDVGAETGPAYIRTTADTEFRTRLAAQTVFPDAVVLGWVHTHPRMRARFSRVDRDNQLTWTMPHSLGLVFDPWDPDDLAVYHGPDSEPMGFLPPDGESEDPGLRWREAGLCARVASRLQRRVRSQLSAVRAAMRPLVLFAWATALGAGMVTWQLRAVSNRLAEAELSLASLNTARGSVDAGKGRIEQAESLSCELSEREEENDLATFDALQSGQFEDR